MVVLALKSNECLCVGGPDGVQEKHRQFILVRAEKCPISSGGKSSVLSCTEVLVVEVTSGCERGECGCVCDSTGALARSRRVVCSCLALCRCGRSSSSSFSVSLGMIPACSFYSLKEVQGYKMLACGVTLASGGA
jgi:hypothetical protein